MNTYRVWFDDGSAVLVNAANREAAVIKARECQDYSVPVSRVEQLD